MVDRDSKVRILLLTPETLNQAFTATTSLTPLVFTKVGSSGDKTTCMNAVPEWFLHKGAGWF
jgi:hypothetical protein